MSPLGYSLDHHTIYLFKCSYFVYIVNAFIDVHTISVWVYAIHNATCAWTCITKLTDIYQ